MCFHDPNEYVLNSACPTEKAPSVDNPSCFDNLASSCENDHEHFCSTILSAIDDCIDCPLRKQLSILKSESGYWKKMHQKAVERETRLKQEIDELNAKLKLREKQLFGRRSEKGGSKSGSPEKDKKKRPRGQKRGSEGHGRRNYDHLPAEPEICDLPENQRCCPECGLEFDLLPDTEDSEIIEVEVKAHRRIIQRRKYKRTCTCNHVPGIVTAPPATRLIPKGKLGISVWVSIMIDKFYSLRPTYRFLSDLRTHGLDISQGTVTDGLKTLAPLFEPIYNAIIDENVKGDMWQADETRWNVFAVTDGKVGYKWYMWVFISESTVVYVLDPSRSARVPETHFDRVVQGILVVDRYSAYKSMAKTIRIILAFCWAHVRRDFLALANNWPIHEQWAMQWVEAIGTLYHLNDLRLAVIDQPDDFSEKDADLRASVAKMEENFNGQLGEETIHPQKEKVLNSLKNHWEGLTVFVDHPKVPMDNNESERRERTPVVGRKNFYGSGSIWSGILTATMFSIFQTLGKYNINPRLWLALYLETCAANGGKAPDDIGRFLPWNMSERQLNALSFEPGIKDSS